ncbi:recombinase family protein [Streptomyces sp. NPDC006512]|uniref:recombinase family protein n=1 Tax=Streptomyces sp. NPDC006512 TaxID=3154307 RepID=UPI0033BD6EB4
MQSGQGGSHRPARDPPQPGRPGGPDPRGPRIDRNRTRRPGLAQALAAVRAGDTLVVPELDRRARSVPDARDIGDSLTARNVKLSLAGPRPVITGRSKPPTCRPSPPSPRTPASISWPSASRNSQASSTSAWNHRSTATAWPAPSPPTTPGSTTARWCRSTSAWNSSGPCSARPVPGAAWRRQERSRCTSAGTNTSTSVPHQGPGSSLLPRARKPSRAGQRSAVTAFMTSARASAP